MPQCAIANCNNTHRKTKGGSVRYHRFPGDPATRAKWLKACGRQVHNCATARVCSRHFTEESYERDIQHELFGLPFRCRLKKGAFPEISLPVEDPLNEKSIAVLLAVGLVPTLQKTVKGCGGLPQDLNKMHVMEDVREGSDVPGAQPSSPGHAEQRSTTMEESQNQDEDDNSKDVTQTNGEDPKVKVEEEEGAHNHNEKEVAEPTLNEDGSNESDTRFSKRKIEGDESQTKRIRSELEQNYLIRDKILNDYIDAAGCNTVQQMQAQMDQILSEIKTLNDLLKEKEREWNNIIHLKKIKEELLLRVQRRKQVLVMTASEEDAYAEVSEKKTLLKSNANSGVSVYAISSESERKKSKINNVVEVNGSDSKQNRQRPVLDVQSIIADYRQRHPETVPRRGRRIRSLLSQGSGAQVKHNLSIGNETNTELGLLLTAVDDPKQGSLKSTSEGQSMETASFKDVLMQFVKLSQHEKQDLLQSATKTPPFSEVTVHPVPAHTQSSSSNSLLHGILTKSQSKSDNSKSTFSPTLARLLTAPERATSSSPHANNSSVSISDMLSNNKVRNEITITPVGGQYEMMGKEKLIAEEEEAEDSADRLVIDEGEALDGRSRVDNGSDIGDDVPQCQGCNQKPAQFVCAGCGNQWYCSRECQVVAWDEHSEVCSG